MSDIIMIGVQTYSNIPDVKSNMPLTVFPVLLLGFAAVLFILATVLPGKDVETRLKLFSAGQTCWIVFIILELIGGLIK